MKRNRIKKYKVDIWHVRQCVEDACNDLIRDKDIAEKLFMKIIAPLEDYIMDECEIEVCMYEEE